MLIDINNIKQCENECAVEHSDLDGYFTRRGKLSSDENFSYKGYLK